MGNIVNNSGFERHIVLVAPEVHWNTGNIGRTCLASDTFLHLVKPLGFSLDSKEVKRAGLDYWDKIKLNVWDDFSNFLEKMQPKKNEVKLFTKNGRKSFREISVLSRMFLVFGSETKGLPDEITARYEESTFHIPINNKVRCLNLSTAVGIALYESLRTVDPSHEWS
ncbi:MAG: tRNA (cytidine(34)-2'-O)-methyltransferase [Desulfobacterales bacterium]|jgi:tRNA (cytidine/uridine-2'-O-)-methyltransferase|nr:tRNA (cytidine(34)-2'-O)-methyltransferase [Desulfobacteraceae bacterium]MBT4362920.1 tRNA (cytidine(34)-2'-O)-methyltransferase [Desulfobacteraceae bacterium]MBT7087007.1 tRNA (cytidine(34)-2'-O)-methyltransferase [Desulfobacterales bacterium]MBT7695819.1 tRNA (cytidine(34)-2'-O)-methyltransferase [Desulfobacterales bacterium]